MLRRGIVLANYYTPYAMGGSLPRIDGPAPVGATASMNATVDLDQVDRINDSFPVSIRGEDTKPNVPDRFVVNEWWSLNQAVDPDSYPWRATAPHGSFRFRPFSSKLDSVGRREAGQLRQWDRVKTGERTAPRDEATLPHREAYLTQMAGEKTPPPSLQTTMDRAISERFEKTPHRSVLEDQRDVGRINPVPPLAGKLPVDRSVFPYRRNTDDWFEYEITKHKMKRFHLEIPPGDEVVYKVLIGSLWEHHLEALAADLVDFFKEIGKQTLEQKLIAVRAALMSFEDGSPLSVANDVQLKKAFNGTGMSPHDPKLKQQYDDEEIARFVRRDLKKVEARCIELISRCNSTKATEPDIYDPNESWPEVEKLQPWIKMVEHWSSTGDNPNFRNEASTKKHEFRKFFRSINISLPFVSTEFEKRVFDTRQWLHKNCTAEYHVVYKKNLVQDFGLFPVERDPAVKADHEHHRLLSFAFDWQTAPAEAATTVKVGEKDTWESIAVALAVDVDVLRACNQKHRTATKLEEGTLLNIPPTSPKRPLSTPMLPQYLSLKDESGKQKYSKWEEVAKALDVEVVELQDANPVVAFEYSAEKGFPDTISQLRVPSSATIPTAEETYAVTEPVFETDTFETVADRVGCPVEDLKKANAEIKTVTDVEQVLLPPTAKYPRRLTDPLLRSEAQTQALFGQTIAESHNVPDTFPEAPENAAVNFPAEFTGESTVFPPQPMQVEATDNWLAYTAKYLDPQLSVTSEAAALVNNNPVWPVQQVPGRVDSTPYEEDQTWHMQDIPIAREELFHNEGYLQDLPRINNELFSESFDRVAP